MQPLSESIAYFTFQDFYLILLHFLRL